MKSCLPLLLVISIAFVGCGSQTEAPSSSSQVGNDEHSHGDEHAHPTEGLHHGELIELGNEEYHAEVVHDEASGAVTVYMLDAAAKSAVPIDATKLLVNLSHDGNAEQFTLAASPDAGDPTGKSSRFVATDAELAEDLDLEGVGAQLVVTIGGKQYRGAIAHDHEGHDHDHESQGDEHDKQDNDH